MTSMTDHDRSSTYVDDLSDLSPCAVLSTIASIAIANQQGLVD